MTKQVKFYYPTPVYSGIAKWESKGGQFTPDLAKVSKLRCKERFTICGTYVPEYKQLRIGVSKCIYPDNFSKQIGRQLAMDKAHYSPYMIVDGDESIMKDFLIYAKMVEKSL